MTVDLKERAEGQVADQAVAPQDQEAAGRAVVRREFIGPCAAAGLKRRKGLSEKDFEASLDHLCTMLDHMTVANLQTLRDVVIDHAAAPGPAVGVWPAEVLIISWAKGMQARPFRLHRIATSWLASVEGPVAEAGGYLVQLFQFLRRHCRPPTPYDLVAIKERAGEDNRLISRIAERNYYGAVVAQADRDWHAAYLEDQRQAQAFVDQGRAARGATVDGVAA